MRMVSNPGCESAEALDDNGFQGSSYEVSAKAQSLTELETMQIVVSSERSGMIACGISSENVSTENDGRAYAEFQFLLTGDLSSLNRSGLTVNS
jgi:hypothetical protein